MSFIDLMNDPNASSLRKVSVYNIFIILLFQPLRRNIDSKLRKRERRLARISLLIVIIFIICHSVKNIPTVFELFGKDPRVNFTYLSFHFIIFELQNVPVCSQILLIGHLLLSINSSVNFLVYSAGNSKKIFRFLCGIVSKTVYNTSW